LAERWHGLCELFFENFGDAGMTLLTLASQQASISRFLN
jgi:hypothetical protein